MRIGVFQSVLNMLESIKQSENLPEYRVANVMLINYHYSNNYFDYDGDKNDQKHTIFFWSNELFFC